MFASLTLARYLASCALEPRRRTELATSFFRGREVGLSAGSFLETAAGNIRKVGTSYMIPYNVPIHIYLLRLLRYFFNLSYLGYLGYFRYLASASSPPASPPASHHQPSSSHPQTHPLGVAGAYPCSLLRLPRPLADSTHWTHCVVKCFVARAMVFPSLCFRSLDGSK